MGSDKILPSNFAQIEDMEQQAKSKELGIWAKSLKLVSENSANKNQFSFLERVTVEMINV